MKNRLLTSLFMLSFCIEARHKQQGNSINMENQSTLLEPLQSEQEFIKALESDALIVMVSADFCGCCRGMRPIFDEIAQKSTDLSLRFCLIDLGKSFYEKASLLRYLEKRFGITISVVPQFLIFKKGILQRKQSIGSQTQEELSSFIKKVVF